MVHAEQPMHLRRSMIIIHLRWFLGLVMARWRSLCILSRALSSSEGAARSALASAGEGAGAGCVLAGGARVPGPASGPPAAAAGVATIRARRNLRRLAFFAPADLLPGCRSSFGTSACALMTPSLRGN